MREVTVKAFQSFDGKQFMTAKECVAYEDSQGMQRLVGLTLEQIQSAANRSDPDLADVFEDFGMEIRETRQKAGVFRRKPSARESAINPEAKKKTNGVQNEMENHGPS